MTEFRIPSPTPSSTPDTAGVPPRRPLLTREDFLACLLIGFAVSWLLAPLHRVWQSADWLPVDGGLLFLAAPAMALSAVFLGALLGQRWPSAFSGSKFLLVGVLNTLVDIAIFTLLLELIPVTDGLWFAATKMFSSGIAVVNSYFWNRMWCFPPPDQNAARTKSSVVAEFHRFLVFTLVGLALNGAVATSIVIAFRPALGLSLIQWANVAAGVALVVSAIWNFWTYRTFVFTGSGQGKEESGGSALALAPQKIQSILSSFF